MEHSAVLLTCIKIPHGLKTFVLSMFEWPLETGFTVNPYDNAAGKQKCLSLPKISN